MAKKPTGPAPPADAGTATKESSTQLPDYPQGLTPDAQSKLNAALALIPADNAALRQQVISSFMANQKPISADQAATDGADSFLSSLLSSGIYRPGFGMQDWINALSQLTGNKYLPGMLSSQLRQDTYSVFLQGYMNGVHDPYQILSMIAKSTEAAGGAGGLGGGVGGGALGTTGLGYPVPVPVSSPEDVHLMADTIAGRLLGRRASPQELQDISGIVTQFNVGKAEARADVGSMKSPKKYGTDTSGAGTPLPGGATDQGAQTVGNTTFVPYTAPPSAEAAAYDYYNQTQPLQVAGGQSVGVFDTMLKALEGKGAQQ